MATEQLYRWDETQVNETSRLLASVLMRDLVNSGGLVPVEPAGILEVFTPRESVDGSHVSAIRTAKRLPSGRYAIVRLEE